MTTVSVRLHGTLAEEAPCLEVPLAGPGPLAEVLAALLRERPALADEILDPDDGTVTYAVMVVVNDVVVQHGEIPTCEVRPGDEVELFPVLAGG
jgi:molybdopterin converting factor small subunit